MKNTKALLMKLKLNNKDLQVKLQDQNDEIKELKFGLAKEQKEIGVDPKDLEEERWVNADLKVQLEEAKRTEDVTKFQLEEKERENQRLEMEVVGLRKKIEKSKDHVKFNESSVILDEILKCQRLSSDKSGLGFKKEEDKLKEVLWSPRILEVESSKHVYAPAHANK